MSPPSPDAEAVAHRLLTGAVAPASAAFASEASDPAVPHGLDALAAPARVLDTMADTLARWFGPYGYHALLTRALAQARIEHPALAAVRVRAPLTPRLDGMAEAAEAHGAAAVTAGVAAVIAGVVDLLGRVIGDDMARHLLEPSMDRATLNDPPPPSADAAGAMRDRGAEGAR